MDHSFKDAVKAKRWQELKSVVGKRLQNERSGGMRMTLDELFLNVKATSFDSVVAQTDILTEDDKQELLEMGYQISYTLEEFKERFDGVDPKHIYYTNSVSMGCFYMNMETLAVCPFHIELILAGAGAFSPAGAYRAFAEREKEVAEGNYWGSILALPDAMRLEYFKLLVDKKGNSVPQLYQLFMSCYTESDYGFGNLDAATVSFILESKSPADQRKTADSLKDLPDVFTIYRGNNSASTPCEKAYSWTLDINTANFFAIRRGYGPAYIVKGEVKKSDVIEYFDDRNEKEVLVHPSKVKILDVTDLKGIDFLEETLPKVAPLFHKYKDMLMELDFYQESSVHGQAHCARVLLLCLILSEMLNLPASDRKVLATAAIYHDTQRTNDWVEPEHGKNAKDYYHNDVSNPDPLVEFLCEYHCLPDGLGYEAIMKNRKLSKNRERSKRLFDVFKDADGLERIRLGDIRREMDMAQYRLPETRQLTLTARICLEQGKI